MQEWLTIKEFILFLLAIYGAALSTFNWRQNVRKVRRMVEVKMSTAMLAYENCLGAPIAQIEVTNVGHRDVTISRIAIELPDKARLFTRTSHSIPGMPDTSLPVTLSDGESARLYYSYEDIGTALIDSGRTKKIKITPVCENSAGDVYKGNSWEVDPSEFVCMSQR
jgi:hypothetical protein